MKFKGLCWAECCKVNGIPYQGKILNPPPVHILLCVNRKIVTPFKIRCNSQFSHPMIPLRGTFCMINCRMDVAGNWEIFQFINSLNHFLAVFENFLIFPALNFLNREYPRAITHFYIPCNDFMQFTFKWIKRNDVKW